MYHSSYSYDHTSVRNVLHLYLLLRQTLSLKVLPMSVDLTGSNANNPDTASLASVESPPVAISVPGLSTSIHASPTSVSVGPSASTPASPSIPAPASPSVTATASPAVSALGNPSVSAPANPSNSTPVDGPSIAMPFTGASIYIPVAGPSVSTPVRPFVSVTASPSAHENSHRSNTPPSINENADDQEQTNNRVSSGPGDTHF
ncbi:hypothetical protein K435DRAFT_810402 [Dendrothele bispora CBS 962.96]|uniref:Uncharacterized protein n=1 Tax=Dendrothele bispora (strain CBS 962.96) TaxID=1314807 RepID=A0A4S8KVJ0_DENBC|nr:hypothetical protein K435DRAFT_810402 [Dendrothele bispora CBS 962.96]